MAFTRSYYWRAVRELARDQGISVKEARKQDWQAYAQAERERRSEAAHRGAETRARREREAGSYAPEGTPEDWVVEEPIDEVGGRWYP
jgi:hypothetical protein